MAHTTNHVRTILIAMWDVVGLFGGGDLTATYWLALLPTYFVKHPLLTCCESCDAPPHSHSLHPGMLATQMNDKIHSNELDKFSIVQVERYICNTIHERK